MQVVIIGAGRSGRGYLGRLAAQSGAAVTFLDRDAALVDALRGGSYTIRFFGDAAQSVTISGYQIDHIEAPAAVDALAAADLILTAVGQSALPSLIPPLTRALAGRSTARKPVLLTCENGIQSSAALQPVQSLCHLSEAAIFCTTILDGLDIRSQNLSWLPYDETRLPCALKLYGFSPEPDFSVLLQRKIYTYNCLSACICYLGHSMGYESYAEAANDPHIAAAMQALLEQVNPAICRKYHIPRDAQARFAQQAVDKFQNREIADSIQRNARNVTRKLGPAERIIAPLRLILECGGDPDILLDILAAAILYGARQEPDAADWTNPRGILTGVCQLQDVRLQEEILLRYRRMEGAGVFPKKEFRPQFAP